MPIDNGGKRFLATDAAILVDAFDGALRELQVDRTRPEALVVAEHIITFVKAGERDPVRLRDLTVKAVQTQRAAILGRVLRSLTMGALANPFL